MVFKLFNRRISNHRNIPFIKPDLMASYSNILMLCLSACLVLVLGGCAATGGSKKYSNSYVINGQRYYILASADGFKEKGLASWYGNPFHGRKTASGEVYDMYQISAAHKTLPLHTWVEVRNLENNKVMYMRVNDRGPFVAGRIIDLSYTAAQQLGVFGPGTAKVQVKAITSAHGRQMAEADRQARKNAVVTPAKTPAKASPKKVAAKPAAQSSGKYGVQVAAINDAKTAQKVAQELRREFSPVNMGAKHVDGVTKFFIYVEGAASEKEAQALKTRLASKGYTQAKVVRR